MSLKFSNDRKRFEIKLPYENRHVARNAGFRWDGDVKVWYTGKAEFALTLKHLADDSARTAFVSLGMGTFKKPAPAKRPKRNPELKGLDAVIHRCPTYFASEDQFSVHEYCLDLVNGHSHIKRVLVVCPVEVRIRWLKALREGLSGDGHRVGAAVEKQWPLSDPSIVVMPYDWIGKHLRTIEALTWDLIFVDESMEWLEEG